MDEHDATITEVASLSRRPLLRLDYELAEGNVLRVAEVVRDKRYELRLFKNDERVGSVLEVKERFWRKSGSLKYTIRQVRDLLALSLGVPDVGSLPSSSSLGSPTEVGTLAEKIEDEYELWSKVVYEVR